MQRNDRDRLARVLGMLGSAHDGEALNAARLADRLVRSSGHTWADVLQQPPILPQRPVPQRPLCWRTLVLACRSSQQLNEWEAHFLAGIAGQTRLSDRQRAALYRTAERLGVL